MKMQYTTRFEDFTEFMIHHHTRPEGMRRALLKNIAIVLVFSCAITAVLYYISHIKNHFYFLRFILIIPLFAISQYMACKRYPEKLRADMPNYRKNVDRTAFAGQHELETMEDGTIERRSGKKTAWPGIIEVATTDDHTFIYITASRAHVIPRARVKKSAYNNFMEELEEGRRRAAGRRCNE